MVIMSNGLTTKTFKISGMTCINCQNKIERELKNTKGIINAKVNYSNGTATITFNSNVIRFSAIENSINNLGYNILDPERSNNNLGTEKNSLMQILGVIFVLFALYTPEESGTIPFSCW